MSKIGNHFTSISEAMLNRTADLLDGAEAKSKSLKSNFQSLSAKASAKMQGPRQALGQLKNNIFKHENDTQSQGTLLDMTANGLAKAEALAGKAAQVARVHPRGRWGQ